MKNFVTPVLTVLTVMMSMMMFGQELPEVIPPSPTVANLMQFEEVPVSYYTGQPNISIPIYSKVLASDLGMNISLNYNTQGVQINNRSGWTGTSWSLMAGGSVSRTVRGVPDESTPNDKKGALHLPEFWNYDNLSIEDKKRFNWNSVGSSTNKNDTEVDLYQFSFLNYSGRFVIVMEGGIPTPKLISKNENFKIVFSYNTNYVISGFTITDTKGYQYIFNQVETSTTSPFVGSTPQGGVTSVPASGASSDYTVNTAWHLTSIKSSNNKVLATLTYSTELENYVASVSRTYNDIIDIQGNINNMLQNPYNVGVLKPENTISYINVTTPTQKLASIEFRDLTKIYFDVKPNDSHPETGGAKLENIRIEAPDGSEYKRYTLDYDTTTDFLTTPISHRLWLLKVTEKAGAISHDYNLSYHNRASLPGFDSYESGPWGYYSGIGSTTLACGGPQTFDDDQIKTGLLTAIEYPTGGVKRFEFEHNTYAFYGNQPIGYDDYMKNPRNSSRDNDPPLTFSYSHPSQSSTLPMTVNTVTLGFEQDIYISSHLVNGTTATASQLSNYRLELVKNGTSYSGLIELGDVCRIVKNVPAGVYQLKFRYGGSGGVILNEIFDIHGTTSIDYVVADLNPDQEMIGGGVRIKEITFNDTPTTLTAEKKITYSYNQPGTGGLGAVLPSSGVIDAKEDILERSYVHHTKKYLFGTEYNSPTSFTGKTVTYQVIEKGVNVDLSQGSYVGYRNVKVSETNNGYTRYSFTSAYDFPSGISTFYLPHATPKENLDYKRGLLLEQEVYDKDHRILKRIRNRDDQGNDYYDFDQTPVFTSRYAYKGDFCEYMQFYDTYESFRDTQPKPELVPNCSNGKCLLYFQNCGGAITQLSTVFESGWVKLLQTDTIDYFYDSNGNQSSVKTIKYLDYNDENLQLSEQRVVATINGVLEELKTKYYYPVGDTAPDYNDQAMLTRLEDINKINEVVAVENFKDNLKLSQTNTYFKEFENNLILPEILKVAKGNGTFNSRIEFNTYDSYGNPLEVNKTEGVPISYIWGYHHTFPVAKLVGVSFSDIETLFGNNFNAGVGALTSQQITDLRSNFPSAQISVYEYDPMIGITKMTDAREYLMTYYYDDYGRLDYVTDKDGNILTKNEYNYKNQY